LLKSESKIVQVGAKTTPMPTLGAWAGIAGQANVRWTPMAINILKFLKCSISTISCVRRFIMGKEANLDNYKRASEEIIKERKNDSSIQTQVNTLQSIISRMASNSSNCKTWAVTIISAILVVLIDKQLSKYYLISYIPLFIFWVLDCYYLGMERIFRKRYNNFIDEIEGESFSYATVFRIHASEKRFEKTVETVRAFLSFSTSPIYIFLGIIIFLVSGK